MESNELGICHVYCSAKHFEDVRGTQAFHGSVCQKRCSGLLLNVMFSCWLIAEIYISVYEKVCLAVMEIKELICWWCL